jgi:hypothetical protein
MVGVICGIGIGIAAMFMNSPGLDSNGVFILSQVVGVIVGLGYWVVAYLFNIPTSMLICTTLKGIRSALFVAILFGVIDSFVDSKPPLTLYERFIICILMFFISVPFFSLLLLARKNANNLRNNQRLFWNWQNFKKNWRIELYGNIKNGIVRGFLLTSMLGFIICLCYLFGMKYGDIPPPEGYDYKGGLSEIQSIILIMFLFGTVGVFIGLAIGTPNGLIAAGRVKKNYLPPAKPYEHLISSLSHLDTVFFEHFIFRFLCFWKGHLPLSLVSFLNEMTKRNILESQGGRWKFRHDLIQEYFENVDIRKEEKVIKYQVHWGVYYLLYGLSSILLFFIVGIPFVKYLVPVMENYTAQWGTLRWSRKTGHKLS